MKKHIFRLFWLLILTVGLAAFSTVYAQNGDPPPPPSQHGETGNQPPGGGAPIGEGLAILALLGTGYGARKWYKLRKKLIV